MFSMPPSARNPQRELHVKALNKIATSIDLPRIANNAGKPKVEGLIQAVREHVDCNGWTSAANEDVFEEAVAAYFASWTQQCEEVSEDTPGEWKFLAFQATYKCTADEWTATDMPTQSGLFDRFKAFALSLGAQTHKHKCHTRLLRRGARDKCWTKILSPSLALSSPFVRRSAETLI